MTTDVQVATEPAVQVAGLRKTFGSVVAVDGVLQQVRPRHRPQLTVGTRRRHHTQPLDSAAQPLDRSRHRVGDRRLGCL